MKGYRNKFCSVEYESLLGEIDYTYPLSKTKIEEALQSTLLECVDMRDRIDYLESVNAGVDLQQVQVIIDYIDEGEVDIEVVKAELGELILRATGNYY